MNYNSGMCSHCNNRRSIKETRTIKVDIPKGIHNNGIVDSLPEWGTQASKFHEIPGKLVIVVKVLPHPHFERKGDNLLFKPRVSLRDSLVGTKITIPHLSGSYDFDTTGFGIINPNQVYTIVGRGLPNKYNQYGNLDIQFSIEYQKRTFTQSELDKLKGVFDDIGL